MKSKISLICFGVAPLMASCTLQPLALGPVGPNPSEVGASSINNGDLIVYSETEEYYEDQMSYFPHSDYSVYTPEGELFKRVWNHQTHEDESPTEVSLPPGRYVVKAWAEFYGLVSVPVVIKANRTTKLVLQPGWKPAAPVPHSDLVQIPNGYFVGWRGDLPADK